VSNRIIWGLVDGLLLNGKPNCQMGRRVTTVGAEATGYTDKKRGEKWVVTTIGKDCMKLKCHGEINNQ